MKKDTIIFDLDGTLLNTLEDLYTAFNYAIKNFGYPERTIEEIISFLGNVIKKAIERALPESVSEEELQKIISIFKEYYEKNIAVKTNPYDGILPLLKELKNKSCKIAVVSNKYDNAVKELCKKYFGEYIDIAIGESTEIPKKPNPQGVLKAIKELNSSIESSVYIGDSEVDIQTAKNADLPCISVLWGFKDKDFLVQNGGKYFAKKPKDIIEIIEKKLYLI